MISTIRRPASVSSRSDLLTTVVAEDACRVPAFVVVRRRIPPHDLKPVLIPLRQSPSAPG